MRPRIVDVLNAFFHTAIFDWLVPVPAMMYVVAMLTVLIVLVRRSKHGGLSGYHAAGTACWVMVGGLLGSRVFYLIQHLQTTLANPWQILDPTGGLASWGGYLGGFIGLLSYCLIYKQTFLRYADAIASCLGLGIALGRWSCFLNGDDYGTLSNLPWAVRFPHGSYPFVAQVRAGLISSLEDLSLPIHPVQLYLSLNGLFLFLLASWFYPKFRQRLGATFCLYWLCYCSVRFLLEFFRGDQTQLLLGTLTVPQVMAILTVAPASYGLWLALHRNHRLLPKPSFPLKPQIEETT